MSMNVSSAQAEGTIEGFKYESRKYGFSDSPGYNTIEIYIPSKKLGIKNDGSAHTCTEAGTTLKAHKILDKYLEECNKTGRKYDHDECHALRKKANQEATSKVQVPVNKIDEIKSLVQKKEELKTNRKNNSDAINKLANEIIIKSKKASSPECRAGSLEGFRYENYNYGFHSLGHNTVSIYIPSKKLTISDDGKSTRMGTSFQAIIDKYLDDCNKPGQEFHHEECKTPMKKANEAVMGSIFDDRRVDVPAENIDEINSLLEKKEELEARYSPIKEAISKMVKELF